MLKAIILGLINRVFGLNITESQLDAFIEFIKMIIGLFGGSAQAANYAIRMIQLSKRMDDKQKMRAIFEDAEQVAKKVVQG